MSQQNGGQQGNQKPQAPQPQANQPTEPEIVHVMFDKPIAVVGVAEGWFRPDARRGRFAKFDPRGRGLVFPSFDKGQPVEGEWVLVPWSRIETVKIRG